MIDTISIRSPYLSDYLVHKIEKSLEKKIGITCSTGEIFYEITSGMLSGTWDNRISIRLDDGRIKKDSNGIVRKMKIGYSIRVECSVHKLKEGHNLFGGFVNFEKSVAFLVRFLELSLGVDLPLYKNWEVLRIDYAFCFDLGSLAAVKEWFVLLGFINFPRRRAIRFDTTGIYFPGSTTTVKFYSKGIDFKKHDYKRLKGRYIEKNKDYVDELQKLADKFLRVEVEIKARKLRYDLNNDIVYVSDITDDYLNNLYDYEIDKIFREGEKMKRVNKVYDVETVLLREYGESLGRTLLGTWFRFATFGEEKVKSDMAKRTFYRHRKLLEDAGVDWRYSDIEVVETRLVPVDFSVNSESPYIVKDMKFNIA